MSKQINIKCSLKEAYIIKHALRDKIRDSCEEKLYNSICVIIDGFKVAKNIKGEC